MAFVCSSVLRKLVYDPLKHLLFVHVQWRRWHRSRFQPPASGCRAAWIPARPWHPGRHLQLPFAPRSGPSLGGCSGDAAGRSRPWFPDGVAPSSATTACPRPGGTAGPLPGVGMGWPPGCSLAPGVISSKGPSSATVGCIPAGIMGWQRGLVPRKRQRELLLMLLVSMKATNHATFSLGLPEHGRVSGGGTRVLGSRGGSEPLLVTAVWWLDWYRGRETGGRKKCGEKLLLGILYWELISSKVLWVALLWSEHGCWTRTGPWIEGSRQGWGHWEADACSRTQGSVVSAACPACPAQLDSAQPCNPKQRSWGEAVGVTGGAVAGLIRWPLR